MKIGSMPRQQALQALQGCEQAALAKGDHDLSKQLTQDLVLLSRKSRGGTVYEMYENAHRSSLRHQWWADDYRPLHLALAFSAAGGIGVAGWAYHTQAPGLVVALGAVFGSLGGMAVGTLPAMALKAAMGNLSNSGQLVMEALDRNAPRLATTPATSLPSVSRQQLSDWLKQDQASASDRGDLRQALELQMAQRALTRDSQMGVSELHHWAAHNRNAATATSLHHHLGTLFDRERLQQMMTGSLDPASMEWLEDEVRIGDQTLPKLT